MKHVFYTNITLMTFKFMSRRDNNVNYLVFQSRISALIKISLIYYITVLNNSAIQPNRN